MCSLLLDILDKESTVCKATGEEEGVGSGEGQEEEGE